MALHVAGFVTVRLLVFMLLVLLCCGLSAGVVLLGLLHCGLSAGVHVAGVVTLLAECWCSCCWCCYIVV